MEKEKQKKMERNENLNKANFEENSQPEESNNPLKSKFVSVFFFKFLLFMSS